MAAMLGQLLNKGIRATALGDEVGHQPIFSDMPAVARAAKAAEQVRAMAADKVTTSWATLHEEFRVQKLVWESVALTRKETSAAIPDAEARLRHVLDVQQSGDVPEALRLLDDVVREYDQDGGVLSVSMLQSCRDVINQDGLVDRRNRLAERLAAVQHSYGEPDKSSLEDLVSACSLDDKKLQRRVRQVLMLPVPEELGEAVSKPKISNVSMAPVSVTGSRTLSQIVGTKMGPPVSVTGSRMSTSSTGQPVGGRASLSNRGQSLGAIATATESMRSVVSVKPGSAAGRVKRMAADCPGKAWTKLQEEFDVQKMVWQSVALTKVKPSDKSAFLAETEGVGARVQELLDMRGADPEEALRALEHLVSAMPQDSEGRDVLNQATTFAAQDVLNQHEIAPLRLQLAERLDDARVPATLPRGAAQKKEVADLVVKCDLADPNLERTVRQMLLLPIPAELGPAPADPEMAAAKSAVSSRRSSSTGVIAKASKKDSLPVRVQPTAGPRASKPVFKPPERILESI